MRRVGVLPLAALLLLPVIGCASVPYEFGRDFEAGVELRSGEEQIERGRPHRFLDGVGHYVISLPGKLLLWSWKVDDHRISPETEQSIRVYLTTPGSPPGGRRPGATPRLLSRRDAERHRLRASSHRYSRSAPVPTALRGAKELGRRATSHACCAAPASPRVRGTMVAL